MTDTALPKTKDPDRVQRGRQNVTQRRDYQVSTLQDQGLVPLNTPHEIKILQYRDQILKALSYRTDPELFRLLDERSLKWINSVADNTEIARHSDFLAYIAHCDRYGIQSLPLADANVESYLNHLWAEGKKRATIDRHLASLVAWADLMDQDDPRRFFNVKTTLKKIRKDLKSAQRQAEGLRVAHLEQALALFNPEVPRDCLDIALLFVGFETMSRRSELVSFDWEDLTVKPDGTARLFLESSKTDQEGKGKKIALSVNTTSLLLGWYRVSGKRSGAIFRGIYSNGNLGQRMSTRAVSSSYKRTARRLGLDERVFSGHSCRVGGAQEQMENNIDLGKIALSGRWKSTAMILQYAEDIEADRTGMADMTKQLGWDKPGLKTTETANTIELPDP